MSDLSDQINEMLDRLHRSDKQVVMNAAEVKGITDIPEYKAHAKYFGKEAVLAVRRIYRKFGGSDAFKDPQDAMDRTEEPCMEALLPLVMRAFADGVQLGQGASPAVKRHRFLKKTDEIFTNEDFRSESDMFCLRIMDDYEAYEIIERYLRNAISGMAGVTAFRRASPEGLQKIWDLWALASNSAAVGMFSSGHALGKEWAELTVLEGIVSATVEADEKADDE